MGGVKHFNVAVDSPDGSIELIKYVLQGANKEVEEGSEERKGGAGAIGKCFYSAGVEAVRLLPSYVDCARVALHMSRDRESGCTALRESAGSLRCRAQRSLLCAFHPSGGCGCIFRHNCRSS